MISVGTNICDARELLRKTSIDYLINAIRRPKPGIEAKMRQLRLVRQLSEKQYTALKRQLPYFVCGLFNPATRRAENFSYTEYFVVDVDHISDKGYVMADIKKRLADDEHTLCCFTSPGGDGLKIMIRLNERCYDASLYKVFYRLFVQQFSQKHGIEQVIDAQTCDVTRACFISVDPELTYNPLAEPVVMSDYIDAEKNVFEALELKRQTEKEQADEQKKAEAVVVKTPNDPDAQVMDEIRKRLNPNGRPTKQKAPVYVPKEVNDIMEGLKAFIEQQGVALYEVIDIQYGKKLRFRIGHTLAEINLFFGKHGFTAVQSPRTGTNAQMNALMAEVVDTFIAETI